MISEFVAAGYILKAKPIGRDAVQLTVSNKETGEVFMLVWHFRQDSIQARPWFRDPIKPIRPEIFEEKQPVEEVKAEEAEEHLQTEEVNSDD